MAKTVTRDIDLGIVRNEQKAVLELATGKGAHGGIKSCATVYWLQVWERGTVRGTVLYEDFNCVVRTKTAARVTQKAIDTEFAAAFPPAMVEHLIATAKLHYGGGLL
jgi:hypothetical protein